MSSDDSSLTGVKQLYYQHKGQNCGYRPDIQPLDKRNTPQGHYAIWGPIHHLANVDTTYLATNTSARTIIAYLTGQDSPPQGTDLIRLEASSHVVPPCAMTVQHSAEMGPMTPDNPSIKCGQRGRRRVDPHALYPADRLHRDADLQLRLLRKQRTAFTTLENPVHIHCICARSALVRMQGS